MFKTNFTLIILLGFIFLLGGCALDLKKIDDKIGEGLNKIHEEQQNDLINIIDKDKASKFENGKNTLNSAQKELINKWLEDNGFNRYGDPVDTMYTGGTPLFNEETGESIDRYDYILERQPDILNLLDNSNTIN